MYSNAIMIRGISIPTPEKPIITIIAGLTFTKLAKKKEHFTLTIYTIEQASYTYKVRDRARHAAIYMLVPKLKTDLPTAVAAAAITDDKIWR